MTETLQKFTDRIISTIANYAALSESDKTFTQQQIIKLYHNQQQQQANLYALITEFNTGGQND